jgi:hypothetical protein
MARSNIVQAMYGDIAPPPDAIDEPSRLEEWGEGYGRMYTATWRVSPERVVNIFGVQYNDLSIERNITADIDDEPMTAAEGRQLAAALLEAADALDQLSS